MRIDPDSPRVHRDENGLPIHGLLGAHPGWTVLEAGASSDAARLRAELDFGAYEDLLAGFPFPHRLEYDASIAASRLRVRLTVTPTGDVAVPISFGLHPYLRLPHTDRRQWVLELPVRRRVALDERGLPTGEYEDARARRPLGPARGSDLRRLLRSARRAADAGPIVFTVRGRAPADLSVELLEGYDVAQVYAPPGSAFICIEPMTAPVNALADGDRAALRRARRALRRRVRDRRAVTALTVLVTRARRTRRRARGRTDQRPRRQRIVVPSARRAAARPQRGSPHSVATSGRSPSGVSPSPRATCSAG